MSKPLWTTTLYVNTTESLRSTMQRALVDQKCEGVEFLGGRLTQEAFINATWLWIQDMEPLVLKSSLAPYLIRLEMLVGVEAMIAGETGAQANGPEDGPRGRRKPDYVKADDPEVKATKPRSSARRARKSSG